MKNERHTVRRLATFLPAVLALAAASWPAAAAELTLGEAMAMARAQSRTAVAARERAAAGGERLREARAYRRPVLSLSETWFRTDSPAEAFAFQLNQKRFSLPEFAAGDPNDPAAIENALTRLEVSMPLYTGGELAGRIRQAELAAEAAGENAAWVADRAALAAAEAYVGLARAREQVALLERSLETVAGHVELARAYVEQGMLVSSELLRAEVEHARIEDLLREAQGMAEVAAANLSFRLAIERRTDWRLAPLGDPAPMGDDLDAWLADAEARRDLVAARRLLEAGELEERVQRSGLLPKTGIAVRRDWNDETLFGASADSTAVMAMARIELFAGGRHRAAAGAARADAEAARSDVEQFRQGIRLEVEGAFVRATSARERLATARGGVTAAAEVERITRERFASGVVKTIDLLDAVTARREAEMRELVARTEAHLAGLALALAAGREPESALPPSGGARGPSTASPTTRMTP
ncbi:MAG: TolC family protein [Acidobacteriota bacterium]|nr:TolC family protein [Acidobacteriota bacterium]MDH3523062.1 TolC family protein [Acidobacteriota bacterium]